MANVSNSRQTLENYSRQIGQQRQFSIILYPDSESYNWVRDPYGEERYCKRLEAWVDKNLYRLSHWAYVYHENDVNLISGEKIKPHFHFGICFDNNHSSSVKTLYQEFGLTCISQIIAKGSKQWNWNNWLSLTEYYNHDGCEGKVPASLTYHSDTPYISKDKRGTKRKAQILKEEREAKEQSDVMEIITILYDLPMKAEFVDFVMAVCNNGYYATFRRSQSTFIQMYKEWDRHNQALKKAYQRGILNLDNEQF